MAKFAGPVGYVHEVEKSPGVFVPDVVERVYYGDVIRNSRNIREGEKVNPDLSISNSIEVVADPYANENILAIRYLRWMGVLWTITEVEVRSPRLIFRLGGVYNGPTAPVADPA